MKQLRYLTPTVVLLLLLLSACTFSLAEDVTPEPPAAAPVLPTAAPVNLSPAASSPDPVAGEAIYIENCAPCHGDTGLGDGFQADQLPNPAPAIGDPELARQAIPMDWYALITEGRMDRFMPPFAGSLSDQQRWDVLSYVYAFSTSAEELEAGAALYKQDCADCHGDHGKGDGQESANLSSLPPDFTSSEFFAGQSSETLYQSISEGAGTEMPAYSSDMSEAERRALAEHIRSLAYAGPIGEIAQALSNELAVETESDPAKSDLSTEDGAAVGEEPAQRFGKVTGVLINGSGGEIPAGMPVTLHGFDHIEEVFTASTTVDEVGAYIFEEIEMPESRVFIVTMDYSDATYNSDIAIVEPGTDVINLPVTVYDTTDDISMLVVDRLHIFLEPQEDGSLHVVELYLLSNPTDKVIVAAEKDQPVVQYKVPEGASGLQFESGGPEDRFIITEDGFADTMGIPPGTGQYQVMYAYDVPYDRKLELNHPLTLPVNSVVLLVPDVGLKVKGGQFQDNGLSNFQGENFQVYTRDRYEAGSDLVFSVSDGSSDISSVLSGLDQQNGLIAGGILFGLSLVVIGVWAVRRFYYLPKIMVSEPQPSQGAPPAPQTDESEFEDVDTVLDAIIALDDMHGAGNLSEEAYNNRRKELFEILKQKKGDNPQEGE